MPVIGSIYGLAPSPKPKMAPIVADEGDAMLEHLAFMVEQSKDHGKFCHCPDCDVVHTVGPMILSKFGVTKGSVRWR